MANDTNITVTLPLEQWKAILSARDVANQANFDELERRVREEPALSYEENKDFEADIIKQSKLLGDASETIKAALPEAAKQADLRKKILGMLGVFEWATAKQLQKMSPDADWDDIGAALRRLHADGQIVFSGNGYRKVVQ